MRRHCLGMACRDPQTARISFCAAFALGLLQACSVEHADDQTGTVDSSSLPTPEAAAPTTRPDGAGEGGAPPRSGDGDDAGVITPSTFDAGATADAAGPGDAGTTSAEHDGANGSQEAGIDDAGVRSDAASVGNTSSKGCGKSSPGLDAKKQLTLQVNGKTRYYLAYLPMSYDKSTPIPMVFALHGKDMNDYWAANSQDGFKLIEASRGNALLVFPQGSGDAPKNERQWGNITSGWDVSATGADVAFLEALRVHLEENYCVDTSRRFLTGFSMGGWMTETFACERAGIFRAYAPVAGWGPGGIETGHGTAPYCKGSARGVPILITQGNTDDIVMPVNGEHSRDFWIGRDACTKTTTSVASLPGCASYQQCAPGLSVHYCTHGGGHGVPADAGKKIWAFFSSLGG